MKTILVDIDGTIADCSHRLTAATRASGSIDWNKYFEPSRAFDDLPNHVATRVLGELHSRNYNIIYVSGRRKSMETVTRAWLDRAGFPPGELHLRETGRTFEFKIMKFRELSFQHEIALSIGNGWEEMEAARILSIPHIRVPTFGDEHERNTSLPPLKIGLVESWSIILDANTKA